MIARFRIKQIMSVEDSNTGGLPLPDDWPSVNAILEQPKHQKYLLWFTTGKIAPSAGQINPDIAHSGLNVTSW